MYKSINDVPFLQRLWSFRRDNVYMYPAMWALWVIYAIAMFAGWMSFPQDVQERVLSISLIVCTITILGQRLVFNRSEWEDLAKHQDPRHKRGDHLWIMALPYVMYLLACGVYASVPVGAPKAIVLGLLVTFNGWHVLTLSKDIYYKALRERMTHNIKRNRQRGK